MRIETVGGRTRSLLTLSSFGRLWAIFAPNDRNARLSRLSPELNYLESERFLACIGGWGVLPSGYVRYYRECRTNASRNKNPNRLLCRIFTDRTPISNKYHIITRRRVQRNNPKITLVIFVFIYSIVFFLIFLIQLCITIYSLVMSLETT